MAGVIGGDKFDARLKELAGRLGKAKSVSVGFLESKTYPDGTPVAYIAAINEFGAQIEKSPRTATILKKVLKSGKIGKKGRFVKAGSAGATPQSFEIPAHTVVIPARPFFRTMVRENQSSWGPQLASVLKANDCDAAKALELMGEGMSGQLQDSIRNWSEPPNAPSTVRKKGFNKPLVDQGVMLNSVGKQVDA